MGYYGPMIGSGMTLEKVFSECTPANLTLWDFTQLISNTTNRSGVVNGSSNITRIDSILPGVVGRNFPNSGTVPFSNKAATINDGAWFEQSSATTDYDFTYVNATQNSVNWTAFVVGNFTDTNGLCGVFGNNGLFNNNTGVGILVDGSGSSNYFGAWLFNSSSTVCSGGANIVTFGTYGIYTIRVNFGLANGSGRVRVWKGATGNSVTANGSTASPTVSNSQKYTLGDALTYGGSDMQGALKLFAIYNGTLTDTQIENINRKISAYTQVAL